MRGAIPGAGLLVLALALGGPAVRAAAQEEASGEEKGTFLDDIKLRLYPLTRFLRDQGRELGDLRARGVDVRAQSRIDLAELRDGGPPKDGIPSIDAPRFDAAGATPFGPEEEVIGLVVGGEAKAYPLGILNWHEIVNDTVGGVPVSVTYCPLCDTAIVFERGQTRFGVSGKLYQSCLVMYDRADDTLYAQPWGVGIVGEAVNRSLPRVPAVKTTLGAWLRRHPDSQVLAPRTGHARDYFRYPYGSYRTSARLLFPVRGLERLEQHPKAPLSYIWEAGEGTPRGRFSGASHAFMWEAVRREGEQVVRFNGRTLHARWDEALGTVSVTEEDGTLVASSPAFAFVYPAFFE